MGVYVGVCMRMWVGVCVDVCVCAWMGVCVHVWMDGCVHGWVHVWMGGEEGDQNFLISIAARADGTQEPPT